MDAAHAQALAATTSFAEIYRLDPALGWLQTWRLCDGQLVGVARLDKASCAMPSRAVASDIAYYVPNVKPRYERADRYLREAAGAVRAPQACFESEGQRLPADRGREATGQGVAETRRRRCHGAEGRRGHAAERSRRIPGGLGL